MNNDNYDDIDINLGSSSVSESRPGNAYQGNKTGNIPSEHHCCHHRGSSENRSFLNGPFGCVFGGFAGCVIIPLVIFCIICASIGSAVKVGTKSFSSNIKSGENYIALVSVEGVMTTGKTDMGLFGGNGVSGSDTVCKNIREAADDSKAKAILIRVNSPGGTPVAAEEIGEAIKYAKTKKQVWTSMADSACSAAYWISSCTDKIYANRTTMTGSIGVIMNGVDYSRLLDKIGVSSQTVKSGKFKDIGSGSRPMTPEEKVLLQNLIDNTYDAFLDTVSKGRNMPKDKIRALADGRVYTGSQALEKGLIDKIGTYDACVSDLAKECGMKKPNVRPIGKPNFMDQLMMTDMKGLLNMYLLEKMKYSVSENQLEMR